MLFLFPVLSLLQDRRQNLVPRMLFPRGGGCCSGVVLLLFPKVFVCPWVEATKPGAPCVVLGGGVLFSRGPGGAGPGSVVQKGPGGVIKGRSVPDILTC